MNKHLDNLIWVMCFMGLCAILGAACGPKVEVVLDNEHRDIFCAYNVKRPSEARCWYNTGKDADIHHIEHSN